MRENSDIQILESKLAQAKQRIYALEHFLQDFLELKDELESFKDRAKRLLERG